MPFSKNKISFSRIFLIFSTVIYAILALSGSTIGQMLELHPQSMVQNHEYWRLLTYAFAPDNFSGFLLFFFTFYLIAPKIEGAFRRKFFPLFLFLLILFQSIVLSVIFWNFDIYFGGMAGISIFIISFFAMMYPGTRINFLNFTSVKTIYLTSAFSAVWLISNILSNLYIFNTNIIEPIAFAAFGLVVASFFYLQLYIIKKIRNRRAFNRIDYLEDEEEFSMAMVQRERMLENEVKKPSVCIVPDPEENEETLNGILEKIFSSGKDSLSDDEKKFLEDYSRQL